MTSIVEMGFMTGNIPAANNVKNNSGSGEEFQNIMTQMSSPEQKTTRTQEYQPKDNGTDRNTVEQQDSKVTDSVQEKETACNTEEEAAEPVSESSGAVQTDQKAVVEEAAEEILDKTAEEMGITVEELENILAQMGLSALDLLEPENVSALVAEVMCEGDMAALITDENMSRTVLALNGLMKEIGSELAEELGIEETELKTLFAELQDETPVQMEEADEAVWKADIVEEGEEPKAVQKEIITNPDDEEGTATETVKETADVENQTTNDTDENTQGQNDASPDPKTAERTPMKEAVRGKQPADAEQAGIFQQIAKDTPAIHDMAIEAVRELTGSSPSEIIEQVNAYIRQNTTAQITEWEMQLNPENLGTVGLNVSTREGAVTAQFTTENEAVKAVMEAQIITLKENLEQQGLKVEAVEVTVAAHEFEQNLQKGDDSDDQMEQEQEKLRKATRKIDLGEWASAEDMEELGEADQVTLKMMQADGNRMDYRV